MLLVGLAALQVQVEVQRELLVLRLTVEGLLLLVALMLGR